MNPAFQSLVDDFLESRRIAIAGYSRNSDMPANLVFRKLKKNGYHVYAVNPNATAITEEDVYPDLSSIPDPVEALFICGPPSATPELMREAARTGIDRVWIHRSVDGGSYHPDAEAIAQELGLSLIPFGCPMMFLKPDFAHKCMKWILQMMGKFKAPEVAVPQL